MKITNLKSVPLSKKARSKRGFTLVEAMASVMILAIVCVGVLNAVAFSREMVYSNNSREKASDKAQLVADEIISAASGQDPSDTDAPKTIESIVNAIANDSTSSVANIQTDSVGKVKLVTAFSDPKSDDELIQYILTPVEDDIDSTYDTEVLVSGHKQPATVHESKVSGWDIKVRVYYKMVGSAGYRVVDVSAFAPREYVEN